MQRGVTAYPLCDARNTRVALEALALNGNIRSESAAARLVGKLLAVKIGAPVSTGAISYHSGASRSTRTVFYEQGVLHLDLDRDERGNSYIRAFAFWPYRPITDHFTKCTAVLVQEGDKPVYQAFGSGGAIYTPAPVKDCSGRTAETVLGAGPTDRSYPTPSFD